MGVVPMSFVILWSGARARSGKLYFTWPMSLAISRMRTWNAMLLPLAPWCGEPHVGLTQLVIFLGSYCTGVGSCDRWKGKEGEGVII